MEAQQHHSGEAIAFGLAVGVSHAATSLLDGIDGPKLFAACVFALATGFLYRVGGAVAEHIKTRLKDRGKK